MRGATVGDFILRGDRLRQPSRYPSILPGRLKKDLKLHYAAIEKRLVVKMKNNLL